MKSPRNLFAQYKDYYHACGWSVELVEKTTLDANIVLIQNKSESYLALCDTSGCDASTGRINELFHYLLAHPSVTRSTILLIENITGDMSDIYDSNVIVMDRFELNHLKKLKSTIPDYQHIQLQAHNYKAYKAACNSGKSLIGVINATGTGKSYIVGRLAQDAYPQRTVVFAPNNFIIEQHTSLSIGDLGLKFYTYHKAAMQVELLKLPLNTGLVVFDEFHRLGAERWGRAVMKAVENHPRKLTLVGTSATHIRYLDNQRNMADELFDGNIVTHLTLVQAIARGILPSPRYISSVYQMQTSFDDINRRIGDFKGRESQKDAFLDTLNGLKLDWEEFKGIPDLLIEANLDYTGKYIVFCDSIEHMEQMEKEVVTWVESAHAKSGNTIPLSIEQYSINSSQPTVENNNKLASFEQSKKTQLQLLFTVNMLNEGRHVKGIDGVILLRKTVSPILFYQQIGRAFATAFHESCLIIDLVGNINAINAKLFEKDIEHEFSEENKRRRRLGLDDVHHKVQITDFTKDYGVRLKELELNLSTHSFDGVYTLLKEYFDKNNHLRMPRDLVVDGVNLYDAASRLREQLRTTAIISDEQRARLYDIDLFESAFDTDRFDIIRRAKDYYKEHGNYSGMHAIDSSLNSRIRNLRFHYLNKTLSPRVLNEIDGPLRCRLEEVRLTDDERAQLCFEALVDYVEKTGNLTLPRDYKIQGANVYSYLESIREGWKSGDDILSSEDNKRLYDLGFRKSTELQNDTNIIDLVVEYSIKDEFLLDLHRQDSSLTTRFMNLYRKYKRGNLAPESVSYAKEKKIDLDLFIEPLNKRLIKIIITLDGFFIEAVNSYDIISNPSLYKSYKFLMSSMLERSKTMHSTVVELFDKSHIPNDIASDLYLRSKVIAVTDILTYLKEEGTLSGMKTKNMNLYSRYSRLRREFLDGDLPAEVVDLIETSDLKEFLPLFEKDMTFLDTISKLLVYKKEHSTLKLLAKHDSLLNRKLIKLKSARLNKKLAPYVQRVLDESGVLDSEYDEILYDNIENKFSIVKAYYLKNGGFKGVSHSDKTTLCAYQYIKMLLRKKDGGLRHRYNINWLQECMEQTPGIDVIKLNGTELRQLTPLKDILRYLEENKPLDLMAKNLQGQLVTYRNIIRKKPDSPVSDTLQELASKITGIIEVRNSEYRAPELDVISLVNSFMDENFPFDLPSKNKELASKFYNLKNKAQKNKLTPECLMLFNKLIERIDSSPTKKDIERVKIIDSLDKFYQQYGTFNDCKKIDRKLHAKRAKLIMEIRANKFTNYVSCHLNKMEWPLIQTSDSFTKRRVETIRDVDAFLVQNAGLDKMNFINSSLYCRLNLLITAIKKCRICDEVKASLKHSKLKDHLRGLVQ